MSTVKAMKLVSWSVITVNILKAAHTMKMLEFNALQQEQIP